MLIESLLDAGLSFREIAKIAKCSHGSVSAQKKEWQKKKTELDNAKMEKLTSDIRSNGVANTVEQMKALKISEEMVTKVQEKLEAEARENVRNVLGDFAYETYD